MEKMNEFGPKSGLLIYLSVIEKMVEIVHLKGKSPPPGPYGHFHITHENMNHRT